MWRIQARVSRRRSRETPLRIKQLWIGDQFPTRGNATWTGRESAILSSLSSCRTESKPSLAHAEPACSPSHPGRSTLIEAGVRCAKPASLFRVACARPSRLRGRLGGIDRVCPRSEPAPGTPSVGQAPPTLAIGGQVAVLVVGDAQVQVCARPPAGCSTRRRKRMYSSRRSAGPPGSPVFFAARKEVAGTTFQRRRGSGSVLFHLW